MPDDAEFLTQGDFTPPHYVCPVDGCDARWERPRTADDFMRDTMNIEALGDMMGVGGLGMASTWAHQEMRQLERDVQRHLEKHTVLEWTTTVGRANTELNTIREAYFGIVAQFNEIANMGGIRCLNMCKNDPATGGTLLTPLQCALSPMHNGLHITRNGVWRW